MKKSLLMTVLLIVALACTGWAGPANPAHIAENAVWVGHADVEKMIALPLMSECPFMTGKETRSAQRLQAFIEKTGLDPRKDLKGVTVWSTQYEGDVGVAIIYLQNLDRQKLTAFLREKRPEVKTVSEAGHDLYSWNMRCMRKDIEVTGTFIDDETILIGADRSHVLAALEVFAGTHPSLKAGHELLKGNEAGTLWFCNAVKVPEAYRQTTRCPVLRQCQSAMARWWVQDETVLGRYTLNAINAETATLLSQAIEGFKALFALRFNGQEPMMQLLKGFSMKTDGTALTVSWRGSFDEIRQAARTMHELHQQMRGK